MTNHGADATNHIDRGQVCSSTTAERKLRSRLAAGHNNGKQRKEVESVKDARTSIAGFGLPAGASWSGPESLAPLRRAFKTMLLSKQFASFCRLLQFKDDS